MLDTNFTDSRPESFGRLLFCSMAFVLSVCFPFTAAAHPSPNTLIFMDVSPRKAVMEVQLPVPELELSFRPGLSKEPEMIVTQYGPQLKEYLLAHIHAYKDRSRPWVVDVTALKMDKGVYAGNNISYWEVNATVTLTPQPGDETRDFYLDYDVIMHQVINHAALISIRSDWENGSFGTGAGAQAINWNLQDNFVPPLLIHLEKGSGWTGFKSMVTLGIRHIQEGTDHLMFLLTLLLPATLIAKKGRWDGFIGTKQSILHLLRITIAFTAGHSMTLFLGATGWVKVPAQPIEILIAFSIFISAIHALRPLFPGKELFIAAGFGLIHGLAFASTLSNLHLDTVPLIASILGFNLGIEFMQLFIVASTIPWLIILSRNGWYTGIRITGAVIAVASSLAWMIERFTGESNFLSSAVQSVAGYAQWIILLLAAFAFSSYFMNGRTRVEKSGGHPG